MTDIGSNPFAEPDFSAFRSSSTEDAPGEAYSDGDAEDLEDEDDFDEGEDLDDLEEVPVRAVAESEPDAAASDDAGNRVEGGTARSVLEHVAALHR